MEITRSSPAGGAISDRIPLTAQCVLLSGPAEAGWRGLLSVWLRDLGSTVECDSMATGSHARRATISGRAGGRTGCAVHLPIVDRAEPVRLAGLPDQKIQLT